MLFDETVRKGRSKKLDVLWVGPYVVEKINDVKYTLKVRQKIIREPIKAFRQELKVKAAKQISSNIKVTNK